MWRNKDNCKLLFWNLKGNLFYIKRSNLWWISIFLKVGNIEIKEHDRRHVLDFTLGLLSNLCESKPNWSTEKKLIFDFCLDNLDVRFYWPSSTNEWHFLNYLKTWWCNQTTSMLPRHVRIVRVQWQITTVDFYGNADVNIVRLPAVRDFFRYYVPNW